jgi:hypothetical protein
MFMNEYAESIRAREQRAEAEARAARWAMLRGGELPVRSVREHVREALRITNLGRLALVALAVMVFGTGIVGLWAAVLESPPRAEVLEGLTSADELRSEPRFGFWVRDTDEDARPAPGPYRLP